MEIPQNIPPLQVEGMQEKEAIRQMVVYIETHLTRMQEEIYTLRQFLEPAIKLNKNSPSQSFNPLE